MSQKIEVLLAIKEIKLSKKNWTEVKNIPEKVYKNIR